MQFPLHTPDVVVVVSDVVVSVVVVSVVVVPDVVVVLVMPFPHPAVINSNGPPISPALHGETSV